MNIALLSKWWWKMYNEEGIWQTLLYKKYVKSTGLSAVKHRQGDSHFWQGLLKIKNTFLNCCSFQVKGGRDVIFWEDSWIDKEPLKHLFPRLYSICFDINMSVRQVFDKGLENIKFRRTLWGESLDLWNHIKEVCSS